MTVAPISRAPEVCPDAFENVCRTHRARLVGLLERTYGHADAEDIAQEALTRYYANPPVDAGWRDPWPWLAVVARNLGHDLYRRRARLAGLTDEAIDQFATTRDVLDDILAGETATEVEKAMAQLSPQQRLILRMREVEGRSFAEIAEHIGSNENAVRQQLFRARRRAATLLEPASRTFGVAAFASFARRLFRKPAAYAGSSATAVGAASILAVGTAASLAGVMAIGQRPAPEHAVRVATPVARQAVDESAAASARRAVARAEGSVAGSVARSQPRVDPPGPGNGNVLDVQEGPLAAAVDVKGNPVDKDGTHRTKIAVELPNGSTLYFRNFGYNNGDDGVLCEHEVVYRCAP